jgi:hypothetical protein
VCQKILSRGDELFHCAAVIMVNLEAVPSRPCLAGSGGNRRGFFAERGRMILSYVV